MSDGLDIQVVLRFQGAEVFPAQLLLGTIEATERAIARAEREQIDGLQEALGDVPAAVFDAMRYRADRLTGRALNFQTANSGSIILAGAAVGLAYWLLDKTLGETVKQAWEDSSVHTRIKAFLGANLRLKAERIAGYIRPSRWPSSAASVEVKVQSDNGALAIIVVVVPGPEMRALPYVDEARDSPREN